MHDTQTAPHDPYRKLAAKTIERAVVDYVAIYPRDTGSKSVDSRRKKWVIEKESAEYFLFKDYDLWGTFHMCCALIKMDPNIARKDLFKAREQGPDKLREIIRQIKATINIDRTHEKTYKLKS